MKYVLLLALLIACTPLAQEDVTEQEADWGNWSEQDGAVLFVSDGRVGAMTFIIENGTVDFPVGNGVSVTVRSLAQHSAVIVMNTQQQELAVGQTIVVDGVSVTLDSVIFR